MPKSKWPDVNFYDMKNEWQWGAGSKSNGNAVVVDKDNELQLSDAVSGASETVVFENSVWQKSGKNKKMSK